MNAISKIEFNAQVGINEVVAIYVSKYETDLSEKKRVLADAIRATKQDITDLINKVKKSIDISPYATVDLSVLGLQTIANIVLFWEDTWMGKKYTYNVSVSVRGHGRHDIDIFQRNYEIDKVHTDEYESLHTKLKEQESDLQKIIMDLKAVNQKERQVRARLAEMKLQEAGVELHSHPELLKLIEIK